jgi:hypothetical protein
MDFLTADDYWLARWLFERSLAAIYFLAFLVAANQFPALLGQDGLLPAPDFLRAASFRQAPSLFHWRYSDHLLRVVAWTGMALSALLAADVLGTMPAWLHVATWLATWALYQSIVNVGQRFYAFGWESMLLEAGFFAAFLGPSSVAPSWIPIAILYWMLLRVELGAGLIKLRGDPSWRDLTALYWHHETQPLPNPLSRTFHRLSRPVLRTGVAFSHFVQVVVPFGLLLPQPVAAIAGGLVVLHQLILIVAGNYSWLNWLTVVLAFLALDDRFLAHVPLLPDPPTALAARPAWFEVTLVVLAAFTVWLSRQPLLNLFSPEQRMNYCWNAWHLVCAYGAFGSVTTERHEIVLEGTEDERVGPETAWREYGFRAKPGDPGRRPPQVAPYHLRLDWLMWFLPLYVRVSDGRLRVPGYERWFLRLVEKLLAADGPTLRLLRHDPFAGRPPRFLRARFYRYRFARPERGRVWERELVGDYLPPVSARDLRLPGTAAP